MIKIGKPQITRVDDDVKIEFPLTIGEQTQTLWYKLPTDYEPYLTADVCDAPVVALLMHAMKNGHDIVSEIPITEKLKMSLTRYLIPFLHYCDSSMSIIDIKADTATPTYNGTHVGTGVSCGVDSLSTIIFHGLNEDNEHYKIDTLCLFNTGYYGKGSGNSRRLLDYSQRSVDFCREFNYNLLVIDSNVAKFTSHKFRATNTYLTCSTVLLLQKYFHCYYYASGYHAADFRPDIIASAFYDIYLLPNISTPSLMFVSACSSMTRTMKTDLIAQQPKVYNYLFVCKAGNPDKNCSTCEKCVRTMLALDALGKSDMIGVCFDEKIYKAHRNQYLSYMYRRRKASPFYREIYDEFLAHGRQIPLSVRLFPRLCSFEKDEIKAKFAKTALGKKIYKKVHKS